MAPVGIKELLEAGVHFGHQTRRWNPKMRRYIYGERDGIYIIDLLRTEALLRQAQEFVSQIAHRGGIVLFVGTKKQARDAVKDAAERAGMPYVNNRWLGGLLTNFQTINQRIKRLHDLERYQTEGQLELLPTRERLGALADLEKVVAEHRPDDVVMTGFELPTAELISLVDTCRAHGCRLRVVPTTTELLLERAVLVPGQSVPLFEVRPPVLTGVEWAVKRVFDIVVSAILILLLAIPGLIVALVIRLTSPGPAIYRNPRVGVGEAEFPMLKFRSMYQDADDQQAELEDLNEADGAIFKIRDDPRITPVGRILRRFSIDELPQLWNVLRGEMSLVGPRPLPLRDYERLEAWHRGRYRVLPGITGLWQVSGRSALGFDDLVRLDFFYVENWSIWLDIEVIARTPLAVLRGRGAY